MHIDFHYFGTYAMARAAGLRPESCQVIASAAQFVDGNDEEKSVHFDDGSRVNIIPTAHPLLHIRNTSLFENDQRRVWLPFHFLPGNEGIGLSERLICRKNSSIAQDMVMHCLSMYGEPFGQHLIGIASHVYADTFSHYGFSGVSSRWNRVDGDSIVLLNSERDDEAEHRFQEKYGDTMGGLQNWRRSVVDFFQSGAAEAGTGALGHGAVLKYPDYPYLEWEFSYDYDEWGVCKKSQRNNLVTYLEACQQLHGVFGRIGHSHPDAKIDEGREFSEIRESVSDILKTQETDREKRCLVWQSAAEDGQLFANSEEFLPYLGDAWKQESDQPDEYMTSDVISQGQMFKFFQAAATYRTYVLRELLPTHGLVVG